MSNARSDEPGWAEGVGTLPADLRPADFDAAPVLGSLDDLLIPDLDDDASIVSFYAALEP